MQGPNLFLVCIAAFSTVFLVLIGLQLVMNGILKVFPYKAPPAKPIKEDSDTAVFAAINTAYSQIFPSGEVTKIEELK